MTYYWKIVMRNGKVYVVENSVTDVREFIDYVFSPNGNPTVSSHQLRGGGCVIIHSDAVASIEYNVGM